MSENDDPNEYRVNWRYFFTNWVSVFYSISQNWGFMSNKCDILIEREKLIKKKSSIALHPIYNWSKIFSYMLLRFKQKIRIIIDVLNIFFA